MLRPRLLVAVGVLVALTAAPPTTPVRTWDPATVTASTVASQPGSVWVVGDSITVLGELALRERLASSAGEVQVNAVIGRRVAELDDRVRTRLARGDQPDVMVLALGTNPSPDWDRVDYERVVEAIPDGTAIVVVTVYRSGDCPDPLLLRTMARYSRWMRSIASERADVGTAQWRRAASRHPVRLLADGVHPTVLGTRVWARLIRDSVDATWQRVGGDGRPASFADGT